jgi:hypothetical protein
LPALSSLPSDLVSNVLKTAETGCSIVKARCSGTQRHTFISSKRIYIYIYIFIVFLFWYQV